VSGPLTLGPFYLPPLLVAAVCLGVAALVARRVRYSIALAGALAAALLIGSATMGPAAISYRISHPAHPLGFAEDWLQLLGEATTAVAALAAARHRHKSRPPRNARRPLRPTHTLDCN
jgi:hypothetical protein